MAEWLLGNAVAVIAALGSLLIAAGGLIWRFSALLNDVINAIKKLDETLTTLSDNVKELDQRLDENDKVLAVLQDRADRAAAAARQALGAS